MKTVRFTATQLRNSGKKGILRPNADGYYTMPVGGLNAFNSSGEFYTLQGAEELFRESSILMRRMDKGYLRAELGHPKMAPGMTEDQYLERILTIEETNVCAHFRAIWLDPSYGVNNPKFKNPNLVAIMAELRPTGPHAAALEKALQNPSENVGFSVRGLTQNHYKNGRTLRVLTTIVTFDQVVEQGIPLANKWDSPGLESEDVTISTTRLEMLANRKSLVATEQSRELAREALRSIDTSTLPTLPLISRW